MKSPSWRRGSPGARRGPSRRFGPLLLLASLLGAIACDSSRSPTEPLPPPTTGGATIVIVDAAGAFAEHHPAIHRLLEETHLRVDAVLGVGAVTFTVTADVSRAIPGWGLGGYAPGPFAIEIVVDPRYGGLGEILESRLPQIAAHEMHHAVRWRGPGYGGTLHEAMISEGLADHFAIQLLGSPLPPWCDAFPESETERFQALAEPELDSVSYDHGAWFFGTRMDVPRWTAYTLGYRLVARYLAEHPGQTAASLVDAPASIFPR